MAARRSGIHTVLLPKDNVRDLEEIDQTVRAALRFVPVATVDEVFTEVLCAQETAAPELSVFPAVKRESANEAALRQ